MSASAGVSERHHQADVGCRGLWQGFHSLVSSLPPPWFLFLISSLICLVLLLLKGHTLPLTFQSRIPIIPFTMMKGSLIGFYYKLKCISATRTLCR